MTIQKNDSAPYGDFYIIHLNTDEKVLLLLTPYAGHLNPYLESVPDSRRVKEGEGEHAEPIAKNANPIMNYHY